MDQEKTISQDEIFEQEEKCQKAIRTVRKAILMRLFVTVLMVWIVVRNPAQLLAWGLTAFVLLINVTGTIPLWQEYRRQKHQLQDLIAQEE